MKSFCVTVQSEKEDLMNGLDRQSVKIMDTSIVENSDSVIGTVTVYVPKLKNTGEVGINSSRDEIYDWLQEQFENGNLVPRNNYSQQEMIRQFVLRELSPTLLRKVIVKGDTKDNRIFDILSELIFYRRLHDNLSLSVIKDYRSTYYAQKAVKSGEIKRFEYGDVVLYID